VLIVKTRAIVETGSWVAKIRESDASPEVALTLVAGLSTFHASRHERQDNLLFEVPLDQPKKIRTLRRGSADPPKIQLWTSS
jgi:hypothetical protein